jgi:hypothetical protein
MLLHHINVVRNFKTSSNNEGVISLQRPSGVEIKNCKVIAFIQNPGNMQISGAAEASIL